MREIKFRAWDNRTKKWLLGYEYPNLGGFSLFGECMLMGEWSQVLNEYILNCERYGHGQDDLIVMQFTGLKDKNGEEIYEGDIVSECVVGQVIWNGDAEILSCPCGVVTQYPTYLNLSQDKKGLVRLLKPKWKLQAGDTYNLFLSKYDGLYTWPKDIEVIGNIYENPELLS